MELVFVHGWGFGPDIWQPLCSHLADHNHTLVNLEFIDGFEETTEMPDNPIVIGHSLGVLWALEYIKAPKALISIAGFKHFPNPVAAKAMKRRLKIDTNGQMQDFWQTCNSPLTYDANRLNQPRLSEGLDWLITKNMAAQKINCPVLPLAAKNDNIILKTTTIETWNDVRWSDDGGHMLPLTQTTWCAGEIEGFINGLNAQGNHCE